MQLQSSVTSCQCSVSVKLDAQGLRSEFGN